GLNATETTGLVCPWRVARSFGSCADRGDTCSSPRQTTHSDAATRRPRCTFGFIACLRLLAAAVRLYVRRPGWFRPHAPAVVTRGHLLAGAFPQFPGGVGVPNTRAPASSSSNRLLATGP